MTLNTQTLYNEQGEPVAVQIPYGQWSAFQQKRADSRRKRQEKLMEARLTEA